MQKLYNFLILIFILISCSFNNDLSIPKIPDSLEIIHTIALDFSPDKCCYSRELNTSYILDKNANEIHIFWGNKKINTIGGIGFDKTNFSNLSDIALAPDGSILALDSFQKKIKKFDQNGSWIAELDIKNISYPFLFDVTNDETYYIYDEDSREIIKTKNFSSQDDLTFGKFIVNKPEFILLNDNVLLIYDSFDKTTKIFDCFGGLLQEKKGYFLLEKNEYFEFKKYFIENEHLTQKFAVSPKKWAKIFIKNGFVILLNENEVKIAKFHYKKN